MYRKKLVSRNCPSFQIWKKFVRVTRRIFEICTYLCALVYKKYWKITLIFFCNLMVRSKKLMKLLPSFSTVEVMFLCNLLTKFENVCNYLLVTRKHAKMSSTYAYQKIKRLKRGCFSVWITRFSTNISAAKRLKG